MFSYLQVPKQMKTKVSRNNSERSDLSISFSNLSNISASITNSQVHMQNPDKPKLVKNKYES